MAASSSSAPLLAVCLVLLASVQPLAAAAATKSPPAACLRAATSLCHNSETDALRCLMDKARNGDAEVPQQCSEALKSVYPRQVQQHEAKTDESSRLAQLSRMLTEGGCFTANPQCAANCGPPPCTLVTCFCTGGCRGFGDCCPCCSNGQATCQ